MLIIPARLTREYIIAHPELSFVHSACVHSGQIVGPAEVCRGISYCYGVPVRWKLCRSSGYFSDNQRDTIIQAIDHAIAEIPKDRPVVLFPKIGCGDSRMLVFAPKCYAYLHEQLNKIKADYKYDYRPSNS